MAMNTRPSTMRTATPFWLSWSHLFALLVFFVAQRFLDPWETMQSVVTWVSALAILGVVGIRVLAVLRTKDDRRKVELTLLLATIGTVVAIGFFELGTEWGQKLTGYGSHWHTAMQTLCAVKAVASIIPIVMIELVLGFARRERFDLGGESDDAVEYRRVREIGMSGLTIALAAGFLMATCSVAQQRNHRADVSYFRTSAPGDSTKNILNNTSEPITVQVWFPAVNEVKDEVESYFNELKSETNKIDIEEHDLNTEPALAKKNQVTKDGTVVLIRGEGDKARTEKLELDTDFEKARRSVKTGVTSHPTLRNLDNAVNSSLMKLVREKRKAYLTVGHGEINDPDSIDPTMRDHFPDARATYVKAMLASQNYEVKNLGDMDGLDSKIPDDATMVMVLGPHQQLSDEELSTLDTYVKGGGNLLISVDPEGPVQLGPLEQTLGVHFDPNPIVDDKVYMRQYGPRVPWTNQFTSHPSITSLAKEASDAGLPLPIVGSLTDVGDAGGDGKIKRDYPIHSMSSSFRDLDGDGKFTEGKEKRDRYNIVAAIEGPKTTGDDGKDKPSYRAMVYADREFFTDRPMSDAGAVYEVAWGGPLVGDAIRWLGGEEVFSGDVQNEDDIEIEQTSKQQEYWFLLLIIGAPLVVLGLGLGLTLGRRFARPVARAGAVAVAPAAPKKAEAKKAEPKKEEPARKAEPKKEEPAKKAEPKKEEPAKKAEPDDDDDDDDKKKEAP